MRRAVLTSCILTSGLLLASIAAARHGVDLFVGERDDVTRVERTAPNPTGLLRLWSTVGRCVVQRDRNTALAFVRAPLGLICRSPPRDDWTRSSPVAWPARACLARPAWCCAAPLWPTRSASPEPASRASATFSTDPIRRERLRRAAKFLYAGQR